MAPATAKATLTFKSSKAKVATVDANGKVTAVGKGKAKITVQDANYKKVKAVITVTVAAAPVSDAKDLIVCWGKTPAFAISKFGFKKEYDQEIDEGGGLREFQLTGKGCVLCGTGKTYETATVQEIQIFDDSPYNIDGLSIGMKRADVLATLKSKGWKYSNKVDDQEYYKKGQMALAINNGDALEYAILLTP